MAYRLYTIIMAWILSVSTMAEEYSMPFVFVEYNCENFFDCLHDTLKNDYEFLPESKHAWTPSRYYKKTNDIARAIQQSGEMQEGDYHLPDIVALCEVENDSVLHKLTRRSALKGVGYRYIMTDSPDQRGIDVAMLYNPLTFRVFQHYSIRITPINRSHATRDVLYIKGKGRTADTLHIFIVHAPSRSGGVKKSEAYRTHVANRVIESVDSIRNISPDAPIIVAGDMNDYSNNRSIKKYIEAGLYEASLNAIGRNLLTTGVRGTYRYRGNWESLDHIMLSPTLLARVSSCYILDSPWLLEEDKTWGGMKPRRTYLGPVYNKGTSDHLPLVLIMEL